MADDAKKRHAAAEKIWLHYFNQELHRKNMISLGQRDKMTLRIENRKPGANKAHTGQN